MAKGAKAKRIFKLGTFLGVNSRGRTMSKYSKGQIVFRAGDWADSVFYIHKGTVKITIVSAEGKELIIAIQAKKDFFGEGCLGGEKIRLVTVVAAAECVIMRFDKATVLRALRHEPKFSQLFTSYLLARKARVEEDLVKYISHSE